MNTKEKQKVKESILYLKKIVQKEFGENCPDFEISCINCQVHMAIQILELQFELKDFVSHSK